MKDFFKRSSGELFFLVVSILTLVIVFLTGCGSADYDDQRSPINKPAPIPPPQPNSIGLNGGNLQFKTVL